MWTEKSAFDLGNSECQGQNKPASESTLCARNSTRWSNRLANLHRESTPDTVGEVAEITDLLHHLHTWPPGLRSSFAGSNPYVTPPQTPARHHTTRTRPATRRDGMALRGIRHEQPTTPPRRRPARGLDGSTADTGATPESRATSNTATPPARNACPPRSSPSTPPGTAPRPSRATSSPDCSSSAATPEPNPRPCNTRSCNPHPRRRTTTAELPTRLALDHRYPGRPRPPQRAADPHPNTPLRPYESRKPSTTWRTAPAEATLGDYATPEPRTTSPEQSIVHTHQRIQDRKRRGIMCVRYDLQPV